MAKNNDELKSLSEIFGDKVEFVVPDYQRGYSWERKPQLEDLWEDLENMANDRNHYTGMFTFRKIRPEVMTTGNKYEIVDGQQRMTTLIILINELLKRIQQPIDEYTDNRAYVTKYLYAKGYGFNVKYRFQYSADDPSDVYFKTQILGQTSANAYTQPNTSLYIKNLSEAKAFFEEKLNGLSQEALTDLFLKVTERLKFNEYMIDDINDVYVTFETMNNRGKSLSILELLKNRLIYLSSLYADLKSDDVDADLAAGAAKDLRDTINNTWKTIYIFLGKSTSKKLSDDAFLRDHWMMYFKYDRKTSMPFKDELLSKTFTAKRLIKKELTIEAIKTYVDSLRESVVAWFNINCPQESDINTVEKI